MGLPEVIMVEPTPDAEAGKLSAILGHDMRLFQCYRAELNNKQRNCCCD